MQTSSASNGKPDGDPLLDELLDQELLRDLVTKESIESLKRKHRIRSFGLTGLLIFSSAATIQIAVVDVFTLNLTISLGLFALSIPLLCLALMCEYWQNVYDRYDYFEHQYQTKYMITITFVEVVAFVVTIFGTMMLLFHSNVIVFMVFALGFMFATIFYGKWSRSLSPKIDLPKQQRNKR